MLSAMKAKGNSVLSWILMAFLALGLLAYAFAGMGTSSNRVVAYVGDQEISVDRYVQRFNSEVELLTQQIGAPIDRELLAQAGIEQRVLSDLAREAAIDSEVAALGLSASDERLRAAVAANPRFKDASGQFDPEAYKFVLEQANLDPSEYEALLRNSLAADVLNQTIVKGVQADPALAANLLAYAEERRSFSWVALEEGLLAGLVAPPTTAQIQAYYTENKADFIAPERFRISFLHLAPEDYAREVEIAESDLRLAYERNLSAYSREEERMIERLGFATIAGAEEAAAALLAGTKSFDGLVAERGLALEDVDLGIVTRDALDARSADAVFGTADIGVVGPVETAVGPALFRVNAIMPLEVISFEEARSEIFDALSYDAARRALLDDIGPIEDQLAAGATLEEIAEAFSFPLQELTLSREDDTGMAGYAAFREATFAAMPGDFPELVSLEDGGAFALRVEEILPSSPLSLDAVVEDIYARLINAQIETKLKERASEFVGAQLSDEALEEAGVLLQKEVELSRNDFADDVPLAVFEAVFDAKVGALAQISDEGRVILYRLDEVIPYDGASEQMAELEAQITARLSAQRQSDVLTAMAQSFLSEAGLRTNPGVLDAVNRQLLGRGQ